MKNHSRLAQLILLGMMLVGCSFKTDMDYPGIKKINKYPANLFSPVWSSTGQEIAVSSFSFPQIHSAIYKFNVKTGKEQILVETAGNLSSQAWSPDGSKIAFASLRTEKFKEGIWIVDADGDNPIYVGPGQSATWSPDGQQMAILRCEKLPEDDVAIARIRIINLATKTETQVYSEKQCASNFHLSWSGDNRFLAFSYALYPSLDQPHSRIYVLDVTSGEVHQLIDEESWSPDWSPNSDEIVFIKGRPGDQGSDVVISNVEGSCTNIAGNMNISIIGEISWSVDGKKFAVTGGGNLYVIDIASIMGENFLQDGLSCP